MSTTRRPRKLLPPVAPSAAAAWMAARGWQPFGFQHDVWRAMGEGRSGLLHATTGAGKTYAVWLGALQHWAPLLPVRAEPVEAGAPSETSPSTGSGRTAERALRAQAATFSARTRRAAAPPLTVLWITPMRALAADSLRARQPPLPDRGPAWTSGLRTGDTASC